MTANELKTMVNAMTSKYHKVSSRAALESEIHYLVLGLKAIGKLEQAAMLEKLYSEIDNINTDDLVGLNIFG